jgi:hypothetical protein
VNLKSKKRVKDGKILPVAAGKQVGKCLYF